MNRCQATGAVDRKPLRFKWHWSIGQLLLIALVCVACQPSLPDESSITDLPNLVLIMADDLGYGGIGCFGNTEIATPHLDSMANHGLKFTNYYANGTVCTPTRASLLTGRYPQRSGMEGVIYVKGETRKLGMPLTERTVAEYLNGSGYATGIVGKWHLGYRAEFNPIHQGFDEFYGYRSGNIDFHTHYDNAGIYDWYHNLDSIFEQGYVTDLITSHAVDFINRHSEQPFFLYVAHQAPHAPFQGRNDPGYRFPDTTFSYYGPVEDKHAAYREMVEVMDESIGDILQALRQQEIDQNTLVVFISDNGAEKNYGHNGSLRGHKTNLFEGGIKVPAIAYWPGTIPASQSEAEVASFDWMPTFLSIAGYGSLDSLRLDGVDISRLLLQGEALPERPLFWRYRGQKAIQSKGYKLIITSENKYLFDLSKDPTERENLIQSREPLADSLTYQLSRWEAEMDAKGDMITL